MSSSDKPEQSPLVDDPEGKISSADETEDIEEFQDDPDDEFTKENEEELEKALTEDIYSLLYTAPVIGPTFIFAMCVFMLQAGLLLLIFFNLVDMSKNPNTTNGESNRIDLPAGAEMEVTIAQFVAILLTVMVMASDGDSIKGIMQLREGYDPSIKESCPSATIYKWLLTGIVQAGEGFLLLLVSFILIMQSTSVIDLTLNLTGLHFIQELDDMGFSLAAAGLISKRTQDDCHHVADLNRKPKPDHLKQRAKVIKRMLIFLLGVGLLIPYFIVVGWQFYGRYMCKNVFVQFGDTFHPEISYYTGRFYMQGNGLRQRIGSRPYYIDETGSVRLAYCTSQQSWTFSYAAEDPCNDFFIQSAQTTNFDVIGVASGGWFAQSKTGVLPADWLALFCNDCNEDLCQGTCVNNICECNGKGLGVNCEYDRPICNYYSLDYRTKGNLANIPGAKLFLDTEFASLTDFAFIPKSDPVYEIHNRLWYITNPEREQSGSKYVESFIVFTGRRWVIFKIKKDGTTPYTLLEFYRKVHAIYVADDRNVTEIEKIKAVFTSEDFAKYNPLFFSTPVDWGTDSFGVEPSQVKWVLATQGDNSSALDEYQADDESPVDAKFMCSDCDNGQTPCFNDGLCNEKGECQCTPFFDGNRCEYARSCLVDDDCYHGGMCDESTNICACPDQGNGTKYYGNLCQYPNQIRDLYYCTRKENYCVHGICNGFEEKCDCFGKYTGEHCELQRLRL